MNEGSCLVASHCRNNALNPDCFCTRTTLIQGSTDNKITRKLAILIIVLLFSITLSMSNTSNVYNSPKLVTDTSFIVVCENYYF